MTEPKLKKKAEVIWIWGLGGVGKTHTSLREAYRRAEGGKKVLLFTLDPSRRLFDLVGLKNSSRRDEKIFLNKRELYLKRSDPTRLFETLASKIPTHPSVQNIYEQMSRGFEDFRHYLNLLELAEEVEKAEFDILVIDTPPFQEARGLEHAIRYLHDFFSKDLVQLALRSSQFSFFQSPVKKVFELTGVFIGKNTAQHIFEFIEWLVQHAERFRKAALFIKDLLDSPETDHRMVLTPESSLEVLTGLEKLLPPRSSVSILMNRSVHQIQLPESLSKESAFAKEISSLQKREIEVRKSLDAALQKSPLRSERKWDNIPFCFMGDDSLEELEKFVEL